MTIKSKLLALAAFSVLLATVQGVLGYSSTRSLIDGSTYLVTQSELLRTHMQGDMMHDALHADVLRSLRAGARGDADEHGRARTELREHAAALRGAVAALHKGASTPEMQKQVALVLPAVQEYVTAAEAASEIALSDVSRAEALYPAFQERFAALEEKLEALSGLIEAENRSAATASAATAATVTRLSAGTALALVLASVVTSLLIARSITAPLAVAVAASRKLAEGDLTVRIQAQGRDEIGQLMRSLAETADTLRTAVGRIGESAQVVATGAQSLSDSTRRMSSGAQVQAASLEEASASLQEISATARTSAESAEHARELAEECKRVADRGVGVVKGAVEAMAGVHDASRRIGDIVLTVEAIAFQTNLLALNAAVEAARAGEHGRGFAVVAAEVRSLAGRCNEATKDIKRLVGDSLDRVGGGLTSVKSAGKTFDEIASSVERVTSIVGELAATAREQSTSVSESSSATSSLDHETQQNAARTEELAATAEQMADQARELQLLVARFRTEDTSTTTRPDVRDDDEHDDGAGDAPASLRHRASTRLAA